MRKSLSKYLAIGGIVVSSFLGGCNRIPRPDMLGKYKSVPEKTVDLLEQNQREFNVDVIKEDKLDIYDKESFTTQRVGDSDIITYYARHTNPELLKKTLDEQIGDQVQQVSVVPHINQLLVKIKAEDSVTSNSLATYHSLEDSIRGFIRSIDRQAPQMMIEAEIKRLFFDYTKDQAASIDIKINELVGLFSPNLGSNLLGAEARVPDRAAVGVKYGIIGSSGRHQIQGVIDRLESFGIVEDLAVPTVVVSNNEEATVRLTEEVPYVEEVFSGGAIQALIKYKKVENYLTVTPQARASGNIYLDFSAAIGTLNPEGPLQLPTTTERNVDSVLTMKQGQSLVVGGFYTTKSLDIDRSESWLSTVPYLSKLFRGYDRELSKNIVLFFLTPKYIEIDPSSDEYDEDSELELKLLN
jgi:general secretion pathway protein D